MNRGIALLLIGLAWGGGIGFVVAAAYGITLDGHNHLTDHSSHDGHAMSSGTGADHDHSELVEVTGPAPTLMVHVSEDPLSGWNVHLMTDNFTFSPGQSGSEHVNGEGHAHIYANGIKLARIYGNWFHIGALPDGKVEIQVTLNANDHRTLAVDGKALQATTVVDNAP